MTEVTVPNVIGMTRDGAVATLTKVNLRGVAIPASSVEGIVTAMSPQAGTLVEAGSRVELKVSAGRVQVLVPFAIGKTEGDAITALLKANLRGVAITVPDRTVAKGIVIAMSPPAGAAVEAGSRVELEVSAGPARLRPQPKGEDPPS